MEHDLFGKYWLNRLLTCVDDIVDIDLWADMVQTAVTAIREEAEATSHYILLPGEAPLLPFCLTLPSKKMFLHTKQFN